MRNIQAQNGKKYMKNFSLFIVIIADGLKELKV